MASDQITTARGLVPALIKKAIDSMAGDGRCMGHFRVTFQVPSVPNRATVDDGENDGVTAGRSCLRYSSPSFAPPLWGTPSRGAGLLSRQSTSELRKKAPQIAPGVW